MIEAIADLDALEVAVETPIRTPRRSRAISYAYCRLPWPPAAAMAGVVIRQDLGLSGREIASSVGVMRLGSPNSSSVGMWRSSRRALWRVRRSKVANVSDTIREDWASIGAKGVDERAADWLQRRHFWNWSDEDQAAFEGMAGEFTSEPCCLCEVGRWIGYRLRVGCIRQQEESIRPGEPNIRV